VVVVIDKDLQYVLNTHSLVLTKLKMLELFHGEVLVVQRVVDEGFDNVFEDFYDFFIEGCGAHWLLDLEGRVVLAVFSLALFLCFFEKFGSVNLKDFDFLLKVVDVLADDLEGFFPLSFVFDLDLNE
jgi:hypothetical protein